MRGDGINGHQRRKWSAAEKGAGGCVWTMRWNQRGRLYVILSAVGKSQHVSSPWAEDAQCKGPESGCRRLMRAFAVRGAM